MGGRPRRFTDRFSLNLGVGYTVVDGYNASNVNTGAAWTAIPSNTLAFNAALNYHFIPNRLVGGLTYTYADYSDNASDSTSGSSNSETKNYSGNIVGVRMQYLIN